MGRDLSEAEVIAAAAAASTGLTKIGCGLRYHPAIARAREIVAEGGIGEPLAVRVRHDDAEAAIDLIHWFAGVPQQAFGYANEQHAFALLRYGGECTASLHASRTPWSSAFSFEAIGPRGSVAIEGVGGADGVVTLRALGRDESFRGPDVSAALEWDEFVRAIHDGRPYMGTAEDGLIAARIVHAIYASVRDNVPSPIRL
jgi:predicted dehydrogenase